VAKAATLRSAPAIEVAMLRSGRVLQRSKNRFDSPMDPDLALRFNQTRFFP